MNNLSSAGQTPSLTMLIAFVLLSLLVLGGGIVTVTRRNLVSAAMALVATFFGMAGIYAMLNAHFLAAIQILVYAGGIMVLFIFVVMVLNREESEPRSSKGIFGKVFVGAAISYLAIRFGIFLYSLGTLSLPSTETPLSLNQIREFGTVRKMGEFLFGDFLFPFEAISILLLIAVLAAVTLARSYAAQATSLYELPAGEKDLKQPAHTADDEMIGFHSPHLSSDSQGPHSLRQEGTINHE